ncbi:unnamed protein product [Pleuronectes platessa]|uniref:Uncharacterized protein n=1 Tax=Pleuronectes platessa TaxID=8262 RepID=A0A9N7VX89_PLEPL|nr:unnamed protein product [Pleuronectes platessa]
MEISAVVFKSKVPNTKLLVPCALSCVLVAPCAAPPSRNIHGRGPQRTTHLRGHRHPESPPQTHRAARCSKRHNPSARIARLYIPCCVSERCSLSIPRPSAQGSGGKLSSLLKYAKNETCLPSPLSCRSPGISPSDDGFSSARIRVYRCSRRAAETLHPTSEAPSPAVVSGRVPRRVPSHSGSSTHSLLDGLPATGWKISALQTVEGAVASGGTRVGRLSAGFIKSHVPDGLHQEDDVHTTNSRSPHVSFNIYTQSAYW